MTPRRLALDIGGVLLARDPRTYGWDLQARPTTGARPLLAQIVRALEGRAHLVAPADGLDQARAWLERQGLFADLGLREEQVHPDTDLGALYRRLGITVAVDARPQVLAGLDFLTERYLFRPREDEVAAMGAALADMRRVWGWVDLEQALTGGPSTRVRALCVHRGRLLLVQERSDLGEEFWILPGGGIDPGEPATWAVEREVREETGVRVQALRRIELARDPIGLLGYQLWQVRYRGDGTQDDIALDLRRPFGWFPITIEQPLGPLDPYYWDALAPAVREALRREPHIEVA